jgi:hypothetical protein
MELPLEMQNYFSSQEQPEPPGVLDEARLVYQENLRVGCEGPKKRQISGKSKT